MCFSASASFTAGAVLSTIGIISIKQAKVPSAIPFAAIPFIFAIQQISEGFLWIALANPGYEWLQQFTTLLFLIFAQVVWPFWVPFSMLKFERKRLQRRIAWVPAVIGAIVSGYLAFCLITYDVEASIAGQHITYQQAYPRELGNLFKAFYMIATIVPPFVSSARYMKTLGSAILISYIMTTIFYTDYMISVWCFFASLISVGVLAIVHAQRKEMEQG